MPHLRRPARRRSRRLATAALVAAGLLAAVAGPASALEPPRPLPGHRPAFVTETDVRPWTDCLWASAAMLLDKWTNGEVQVSHQRLRRLSGDLEGGSSFEDLRVAFRRLGFDVPLDAEGDGTMTWRALLERLRRGGGAVVLGDYGDLPRWYGRWDPRFWKGRSETDNHAVYVERYDARRGRVWLMDPLGRGEWRGEWLSVAALQRYAWFSGGRVQAVATPAARPAPFAGVRLAEGRVGLSSTSITATWSLRAPRRWRFGGADVHASIARSADPLLGAARRLAAGTGRTHDPAPPRPIASVADGTLRASAALPDGPGAYELDLEVTDRRFGRRVAGTYPVAVFVPGPRRAALTVDAGGPAHEAGSTFSLDLRVANTGDAGWADPVVTDAEGRAPARRATRLVATWIPLDVRAPADARGGEVDAPDGPAAASSTAGTADPAGPGRAAVELDRIALAPDEARRLRVDLVAPVVPGRWALVVDIVDDIDGSFAALGSAPAVALLQVLPPGPGTAELAPD